jgi:hypothetical protein
MIFRETLAWRLAFSIRVEPSFSYRVTNLTFHVLGPDEEELMPERFLSDEGDTGSAGCSSAKSRVKRWRVIDSDDE